MCLFLMTAIQSTRATTLPPGFAEVLVAQELDPTAMALAPDGRLFITEKIGRIRIIENGQMLTDPFLILDVDNYNERGLSGIAFDPDFTTNGYLYLYYTVKGENHNRVSRFTADGNYVVPGSETVLLNIEPLNGTIHNAGSMSFGTDGKLYISVGDGADGQTAQSLTSLRGKILRINADGTIPADNPFYNETTGDFRAIYAMGLRNSFSMSIQRGTGRIFATEVGNNAWEEVNEILPGKNYGWPVIEGPINGQTPPPNYKEPVFYYNHNDGCAAVAANFYNPVDTMFPSIYAGKVFFADYCRGYIKYLDPDQPGVPTTFATNINRPLNMVTAPDGTMYYLSRAGIGGGSESDNTASENGTLWRIFYTGSGAPFIAVNPQSLLIPVGEDAHFSMIASGEEPIIYQWQLNKVDIPGSNSSELIITNAMLNDSGSLFRCIVSNAFGADTTLEAILRVTSNHRPEPDILTPVEGSTYRAGDTLSFSGIALDPEETTLGPDALRWKIDFHHKEHTHPGLVSTAGISEGQFIIPQTGETSDSVWYRIHLSATDAGGLTRAVTRDILPVKTQFIVETKPSGLPVYIESNYLVSPVTTTSVVGIIRRIEVLVSIINGDSIHLFKQWSDGESSTSRSFAAADDTLTYTAIYDTYPLGNGTGLSGHYYDEIPGDHTFYEPYLFSRIDTTINFSWGEGSPSSTQLGDDYWMVRWDGFFQAVFDDVYNFYVIGDDGVRLWVDDQMIVDAWMPQPPLEYTGNIALQAGKKYPIRLEYFEEGGGATCKLFWSSPRIAKNIIPKSQLFPEESSAVPDLKSNAIPIRLYPNPTEDRLIIQFPDVVNGLMDVEINNALGAVVLHQSVNVQSDQTEIDVHQLSEGLYWVKCKQESSVYSVTGFVKE